MAPVKVNLPPAQTAAFGPAYAVAAGQIVNTIWSAACPQPPVPVSVSCTCPAAMSARLGVYVVDARAAFPNVPVPEVDHATEVVFVDVPDMPTAYGVPDTHTVLSLPAHSQFPGS